MKRLTFEGNFCDIAQYPSMADAARSARTSFRQTIIIVAILTIIAASAAGLPMTDTNCQITAPTAGQRWIYDL